jgi:hypothetical protein
MDSRRGFIGKFATGLAGTLAAPAAVLGANQLHSLACLFHRRDRPQH